MELKLPIIRSEAEFRKRVKLGDRFWSIASFRGEPVGLEGPCIIEEIEENHMVGGRALTRVKLFDEKNNLRYERFISDIVNQYHGAFTSEHEAIRGLEGAKEIWANNPEIRRINEDKHREIDAIFNDILERLCPR